MGDITTVSRGGQFNFSFAFNDFHFSDRTLRLEITPDDDDNHSTAPRKKLRAEKYHDWFSYKQNKDAEFSDGVKVTTLHVCSLVLAEKSRFFYKMFKSGMTESQQKNEICLKINASEEATLIDLLRFMYGNCAVNATLFTDLVDLLIAADKFEVTSCMSHCVEMLLKFRMSLEHAVFYLELPSSVLVSEIVKPLLDAAKQYVFSLYKNFTKSQDEAMQLPVSGIEVVLGSEGLQVVSEDVVFDFVLKWARASYPNLEERREILTKRLAPLICFPNMSAPKLKEVLACPDFDHECVSKLVHEALFSKVERSYVHLIRNSVDLSASKCGSAGRIYNPHCVVCFDIRKAECAGLFPSGKLDSPQFGLGGKMVYLSARCYKDGFGLYVMRMPGLETCTLDFDFAVIKKSTMEFESRLKAHSCTLELGWGSQNLFGITWTKLMSDDSDYFIDDVLCIKAELILKD